MVCYLSFLNLTVFSKTLHNIKPIINDIFNSKEILPLYNLYKMNTYKKVAKIENRLNNIRFFFKKEVIIP